MLRYPGMIAVYDSGLGGLGVLREMLPDFADESVVYAADRANAPYGTRSLDDVRALAHRHADTLIELGASTIVLACNTASAAALTSLRESNPETTFVGMEPALKPAAAASRSGVVGVLATEATFQGRLFESLLDQYTTGIDVITRAAPEWVELVESGTVRGDEARVAVSEHVAPLLERGADTLVLGCTHFSFLTEVIHAVAGNAIVVIDPAPAVARQARMVHVDGDDTGSLQALVSGDVGEFEKLSESVAGISFPDGALPL